MCVWKVTCERDWSVGHPTWVFRYALIKPEIPLSEVRDNQLHLQFVAERPANRRNGESRAWLNHTAVVLPKGERFGMRLDEAREDDGSAAFGRRLLGRHPHHGREFNAEHDSLADWRRNAVGRDAHVSAHIESGHAIQPQNFAFDARNWKGDLWFITAAKRGPLKKSADLFGSVVSHREI